MESMKAEIVIHKVKGDYDEAFVRERYASF